jgi:zinc finger HIT domain-containing protein 1
VQIGNDKSMSLKLKKRARSKRKDDDSYQPKEPIPIGLTSVRRRSSGRVLAQSQKMKERDVESVPKQRDKRLNALEQENFGASEENVEPTVENEEVSIFSSETKKKKSRRRLLRRTICHSLERVVEEAGYRDYPLHIPTYLSVCAPPSRLPPRHFCSVCGYP